jgi:hypothetical protein
MYRVQRYWQEDNHILTKKEIDFEQGWVGGNDSTSPKAVIPTCVDDKHATV